MLKKSFKTVVILTVVLLILSLVMVSAPIVSMASGTTYYVDSVSGSDSNSGTSSSSAWKSLSKVNSVTFGSGDKILFKAGGSWTGQLYPKGSGSSSAPIVIDMYGTGDKPLIAANGTKSNTLYFRNQSYWEINNLEVTNTASTWGDYRGISVNIYDYSGTINHFYIKDCYVHDVTGEVCWIGGSGTDGDGIYYATGWDASKKTGGIVFDVQSTSGKEATFDDIDIEDCTVQDCSFGGIIIKQIDDGYGFGVRSSSSDSTWAPHTNVTIKDNYISSYNTDHGCNGIYMTNVQGGTIEGNVVAGVGTCGIEAYYCDDVVIEKNETYDTTQRAGGADYNGIDPDKGTTNMVIQYNYVHDNGDGILLCQIGFGGDSVIRYNILQNNSRYSFNLHSSSGASSSIYNNIVYTNKSSATLVGSSGGQTYLDSNGTYTLNNNIFYTSVSGPVIVDGSKVSYGYNCYYGASAPSEDSYSVTSNPLLVNAGNGGDGGSSGWALSSLDCYKLNSSSPCINAGKSISNNGGEDFWGNTLYSGSPDIGAYEYPEGGSTSTGSDYSYEAEEMTLSNYTAESNSAASGGYCIKTTGTGTAQVNFTGTSGTYSLNIWYFDENDGSETFNVYVNGSLVDSWTGNEDLGSASPDSSTLTSRAITGVSLSNGDTIKIEGTAQHYDYARVDKLDVNSVTIEAEDMTLSNYTIESNSVASGGYCIKTSGTGTAQTDFTGASGTYDLIVWYFDENDGSETFSVYVDGTLVDSWTGNQDLGSDSPDSSTLTSRTISGVSLSNGDTIKIEGTAQRYDYARVDKLDIE